MGRLNNTRHELFAQHLASGKSSTESYVLAGYMKNDGNAARLKGNEWISARVAEPPINAARRYSPGWVVGVERLDLIQLVKQNLCIAVF